jgi:predicted O-methyltransferase YrrM
VAAATAVIYDRPMRLSLKRRKRRAPPVEGIRHVIPSFILSADDDPGKPDAFLIDLGIRAAALAQTSDLSVVAARDPAIGRYMETWPGEHYKLLAGLVRALQPKTVVEVGTATGASALAILAYLPADSRLVTFDVLPWEAVEGSVLKQTDFADGRLVQCTDDVTQPHGFQKHAQLMQEADLIFADAAKDGTMERLFFDQMRALPRRNRVVLLFDDIRVPNMIAIWRSITRPKLDLTSFGHWSGTGLTYLDPTGTEVRAGGGIHDA